MLVPNCIGKSVDSGADIYAFVFNKPSLNCCGQGHESNNVRLFDELVARNGT